MNDQASDGSEFLDRNSAVALGALLYVLLGHEWVSVNASPQVAKLVTASVVAFTALSVVGDVQKLENRAADN